MNLGIFFCLFVEWLGRVGGVGVWVQVLWFWIGRFCSFFVEDGGGFFGSEGVGKMVSVVVNG